MFDEIKKVLSLGSSNTDYEEIIVKVDDALMFLKLDTDSRVINFSKDKRMILKDSEVRDIDDFYTPKSSDLGKYFETVRDNLIVEVDSGSLTIISLEPTKKVATTRTYSKEQWTKIMLVSI